MQRQCDHCDISASGEHHNRCPTRPKVVYRGAMGAIVWNIPDSSLTIMWGGPGSRLRIGHCLVAGGATTTIDHPTACGEYATAKDATDAVARFLAAPAITRSGEIIE